MNKRDTVMRWARGVFVAVMLCAALEQTSAQRPGRTRGAPDLQVGMTAPDFELPRLDAFLKKPEGGKEPEVQNVRLSSFRGLRPVVLVFSSYT